MINKKALLYALLVTTASIAFVGIMVYLFVMSPMLMVILLLASVIAIPVYGLYDLFDQLDKMK